VNKPPQNETAMQELRKLLFEKESLRLDELEKLLLDQELHAQEVAKVLAEAVKIRNLKEHGLQEARLEPAAHRGAVEAEEDLIGVGGVASAADAYAKIKAGASLVQLYSALVYQGPELPRRIVVDLARLLKADGYATISDAIGADHR